MTMDEEDAFNTLIQFYFHRFKRLNSFHKGIQGSLSLDGPSEYIPVVEWFVAWGLLETSPRDAPITQGVKLIATEKFYDNIEKFV